MPIAALASLLSGVTCEALPPEVVEAARLRLFDTLACCRAGQNTAEGELLRRLPGNSTDHLIRCAAGTIRSTELDDIHIGSCTTPGSIVIPAAVLAGVEAGCDDRDLLCGLVAGYEAMARLGSAVDGAHIIYHGLWTTYLCAPLAAAAATARTRRLDPGQTAEALAIAASRSTGMNARGTGHSTSRWYVAGCAAAEGFLAASGAEAGMTGDATVFESAFPGATSVRLDASQLDSSGPWRILEVDAKPFRSSRQALAATQAFLQLMEQAPSKAVEAVRVGVPDQVKAMVDNPSFPLGVQCQLALALRQPTALWDVAHPRPPDPGLAARIKVAGEQHLTALYPLRWGAVVEVLWTSGGSDRLEVLEPPGSSGAPFDWDALLEKHRAVAAASGLDGAWLPAARELCRSLGARPGSHAAQLAALLKR